MDDSPIPGLVVMLVMLIITISIGGCKWKSDIATFKSECVKRGVAEWVLDQETGKSEWRWKP